MFPGKYYLGDAGYPLSFTCLTPYRAVRYHLKEWDRGNKRPQNKEELFNLRHSSLRNATERIFGVIKKRFPILVTMPSYSFRFQCDLVMCAFMIHNFIRGTELYEDEFYEREDEVDSKENNDEEEYDQIAAEENNNANMNAAKAWRNDIAQRMWNDYQEYIALH